ncbi:uncharacterized protein LOC131149102 [Malania oleifera]|uniref:uncharacterized protein LOC131149102 n=1 Tax=Malania oleifera TaxID=397392 RepID=UPI0025ADCBF4|nr:uncharacterized protein LOC131149102 [Malania oleifera]
MGRKQKEKAKAKFEFEAEEELEETASVPVISLCSSDDEEANEDLSLGIVEKSLMLRAAKTARNGVVSDLPDDSVCFGSGGVIDLSSSSTSETALGVDPEGIPGDDDIVIGVNNKQKSKKESRKKKKKKAKTIGTEETVVALEEAKKAEVGNIESASLEKPDAVVSDNIVLRKLLRGPRYFDPPDSGWGACYNCGEEGHVAVNCTAAKRKKPCFICGSLEHNVKTCKKGQDCFICKSGSHRAKDCPERLKGSFLSSKICLKCGDLGHDMFLCRNDYCPDDLKEMQCYICKSYGHLCCSKFAGNDPREVSCYQCGMLGHTGLGCTRSNRENMGVGSLSSCYRCGEEGHFARECTKAGKKNRESSTPSRKFSKEDREYLGFRSAPHDLGKPVKKKRIRYEDKSITTSTSRKAKRRGGWIADDPADFSPEKVKRKSWRSPVTPTKKNHRISSLTSGNYGSSSPTFRTTRKFTLQTSTSQGSAKASRHKFSAARFNNSGGDRIRRNYDWW